MLNVMKNTLYIFIILATLTACTSSDVAAPEQALEARFTVNQTSPFSDYWDQGKAEITTYDLKQARYDEIHAGTANTIFVTEPFSKSKQVKLDNAAGNAKDNIRVLKLNFTRKFYTGVYPYSTMLSVFTPQDLQQYPHSLKAVFGAQEWCGQTYTQLNLAASGFDMEQYSYFESEGDKSTKLDKVLLEDELWNIIRINPSSLPTGSIKVIAGLTFSRLAHHNAEAVSAEASIKKSGKLSTYTIRYPSYNRTVSIDYETEFPHQIQSWKEEGYSGYGSSRKKLTTTASLKERKMLDYWNKHDLKDAPLRKELGLE